MGGGDSGISRIPPGCVPGPNVRDAVGGYQLTGALFKEIKECQKINRIAIQHML
jgi:hypothetical protein